MARSSREPLPARRGTRPIPRALLLVLLGAAAGAACNPGGGADRVARARAAVSAAMSAKSIAGLSVAVVLRDRIVWAEGFGFADLENAVPFRASTVHRLASVSKPITAVAAMQLAERGKLDLDAPIQGYCPAFPRKAEAITSRQLLGHLSGIRHYKEGEDFDSTRHFENISDSLEPFKNDPLLHEPGEAYSYSTYGYVVLGCVVEGASGMRYGDYVRDNIARPAGMERTRPDDATTIIRNRARGYARRPDGKLRNANLADTSNKVAGGGMVSTVEDLARFAIALDTGRLLKKETFAAMQVPMRTRSGQESPYFGWTIEPFRGAKALRHSGSQQGTAAYLLMVPQRRFALALLANTEDSGLRDLARSLTDIFLP